MLALKPNCECCDKDLAPNANDAMICSYECTFCRDCVDNVLQNVCPNCGGGFTQRPIRPTVARRAGVSLNHQPASPRRVHSKYTREQMRTFSQTTEHITPQDR
ncbi:MAG: DUF1272 domain-containing protein [Psychrobium sp.]